MNGQAQNEIELVIFDSDDTLWHCLNEPMDIPVALSDNGPGPGSPNFMFEALGEGLIKRNDGRRFALFPEALEVLHRLHAAGKYISLAGSGRVSNGASDTPTYVSQNALQIDGLQIPCVDIQIIAPDEECKTDFMHQIRF